MEVTATAIKALNPCKGRLDNYTNFYGEKVLTKRQFMGLKNITHEDKLWVAFRLMPKDNLKLASADIAELVLHHYEDKYPNDNRPRLAIEAARKGVAAGGVYDAANDAAFAVYDASRAAFAAARAATCAAHVDANSAAANAAAYATEAALAADAAAATSSADTAAFAAADAAAAQAPSVKATKSNIQKQIRTICLKYWKE